MNERSFTYQGETVPYILNRGNRRHCYLTVERDGTCVLKVPSRCSELTIQRLLFEKGGWVLQKREEALRRAKPPLELVSGEAVPLWGEACRLEIIEQDEGIPEARGGKIVLYCPGNNSVENDTEIYRQLKEVYRGELEEYVSRTAQEWQQKTGLSPEKLEFKWMKSSWGRCRSNRRISLNIQLAAYPRECTDYVLLHELCHLQHMNHSKEFWDLVYRHMPDASVWRKRLKNGAIEEEYY